MDGDVFYVAVGVGSENVTQHLQLDTTTSFSAIANQSCVTCVGMPPYYDSSASSTAVPQPCESVCVCVSV